MKANILIVEDEKDINDLLKLHLMKEDVNVTQAFDGKEAFNYINTEEYDLILLDVMMPYIDGFALLSIIREKSEVPVLFLTAKEEESSKVLALGLGADDYIIKPFSPIEVVSRVKANLRRYLKYVNKTKEAVLQNGELTYNLEQFLLMKNDAVVNLNPKEYKILELLMKEPGRIFTKEQIYEYAWNDAYLGDANTIMVHISHVREKIEDNPKKPRYIITIKGLGYKMEKM